MEVLPGRWRFKRKEGVQGERVLAHFFGRDEASTQAIFRIENDPFRRVNVHFLAFSEAVEYADTHLKPRDSFGIYEYAVQPYKTVWIQVFRYDRGEGRLYVSQLICISPPDAVHSEDAAGDGDRLALLRLRTRHQLPVAVGHVEICEEL